MKTAEQFLRDAQLPSDPAAVHLLEAREKDIRAEAYDESLLIFRGLAGDHMTAELEQVLAMLEKAIARRRSGE